MVPRDETRNAEWGTRNRRTADRSAFRLPRSALGFTLLEVLVALTIAGIVVLLAHRLFAAAGDGGRALRESRTALDRESNARRWLMATFLSLDVGLDSAGGFEGRPDRLRFSAWELVPEGWFERRRVVLGRTGDRVMAALAPGGAIVLGDSISSLDFDYLLEPGAASRWVREWVSPVSAPIAIRIRIRRPERADTLLFLIRERG